MSYAGTNAGVPVLHSSIPFLPSRIHGTRNSQKVAGDPWMFQSLGTIWKDPERVSKADYYKYLHACQTTARSSQDKCFSCT